MKLKNTILIVFLVLSIFNLSAQSLKIEKCDCPFKTAKVKADNIWCGKLLVPESRDKKSSRILEIAFTVISPENPAPDPVIILPGGPGQAPLRAAGSERGPVAKLRGYIPKNRTLVVFDPRGTGFSGPIMCPNLSDTWSTIAAMDLTIDEQRQVRLGLDLACRDQLLREGVDLNAYNSITVAQDVNDLMTALGYKEFNLLGGSYGVPMSAMIINLFPKKVRSATLLSGTHINLKDVVRYDVPYFYNNLKSIFELCAEDPQCSKKYPTLEDDFYVVYERLKDQPLTFTVDSTKFRAPIFTLNSQDYIRTIYWQQTKETKIRYFPNVIQAFKDEDITVIRHMVERNLGGINYDDSRMGMLVHCFDSYTENSLNEWKKEADPYHPALSEIKYFLQPCEYWTDEAAPESLRQPFKSDVPALLISGELDPMNPPEASESYIPWFENAQHIMTPGMGHMFPTERENFCWTEMIQRFITHPLQKVDTSCVSAIPEFKFDLKLPKWAKQE